MEVENVRLHRDFDSGRLFMSFNWRDEWSRGHSGGKVVDEPLSDYDKAIIGDMPIPPRVAKVDL
jgi:hypothetical protein